MTRPFIILANQRSGSNFLALTLDKHPDVHCYGEVFRQGCPARRRPSSEPYRPSESRFSGYLKAFEKGAKGVSANGFKMMYAQAPYVTRKILDNEKWSVIFLRRRNRLAQYACMLHAQRSNRGVVLDGHDPNAGNLPFDEDVFGRYIESIDRRETAVIGSVRNTQTWGGASILELDYEDLCQDGLVPILRFLNVREMDLEPATAKRQSSDIASRFQEPNRVLDYLDRIGRPEWAVEITEDLTCAS